MSWDEMLLENIKMDDQFFYFSSLTSSHFWRNKFLGISENIKLKKSIKLKNIVEDLPF